MTAPEKPPLGVVLLFLLFSLIFFSNTYRLWFKTDRYYQDIYDSLTRTPSPYPFRDFFLKRVMNRRKWEKEQKLFSVIGFLTVLGADILVSMAYLYG